MVTFPAATVREVLRISTICGVTMLFRRRHATSPDPRAARPDFNQILAGIDIPAPFDIDVLCERVAAKRGRRLLLESQAGVSGSDVPCGVWIALAEVDVIFFEEATSPLHRDHIIRHEIGHMLLGHDKVPGSGLQLDGRAFGNIDPKTIVSMLGRARFDSQQEYDAERLAYLIAERAGRPKPSAGQLGNHILSRLQGALGGE
jgi:hypothetical protein